MLDLLVIGAGLSGLMAAYTAVSAGLSVRIVTKGLGTMHWGAGCVDLLGYVGGETIQYPFFAIETLIQERPDHPYALLDIEKIRAGLKSFAELGQTIDLPYRGAVNQNENLLLPSAVGVPRPTFLAPEAQLAGDLSRSEPILVAGFQGVRDFYPHLIAENLNKVGVQARAVYLPLRLVTERTDGNPVQLAEALDSENRVTAVAKALKQIAQPGERIGLPAILGMNNHQQVLTMLTEQCGAPIFEIPLLPPSLPGMRLYRKLNSHLQKLGVRIEMAMEVVHSQTITKKNDSPGQVQWVESATSARPLRHRAKNFLLATGGILGGGFNSDQTGRVWETIFDLPLFVPNERTQWFAADFLNPQGHPIFNGGVVVNANFQPVNAQGQPIYSNLWAAGHLLAGADPIVERSMEAQAIVIGIAAGKAILQYQPGGTRI